MNEIYFFMSDKKLWSIINKYEIRIYYEKINMRRKIFLLKNKDNENNYILKTTIKFRSYRNSIQKKTTKLVKEVP